MKADQSIYCQHAVAPLLDTSIQTIITPFTKGHARLGFFQSCVDEGVGVEWSVMFLYVRVITIFFSCTLYVGLCLCWWVSGSMSGKMSHVFVFTCLIAPIRGPCIQNCYVLSFFCSFYCIFSFFRIVYEYECCRALSVWERALFIILTSLVNPVAVAVIYWLYLNHFVMKTFMNVLICMCWLIDSGGNIVWRGGR